MILGEVWVYGGRFGISSSSTVYSDVRKLTLNSGYTSGVWTLVATSGTTPSQRYDHSAAAFQLDGSILAFSGRSSSSSSATLTDTVRLSGICGSSCPAGAGRSASGCSACASGWNSNGGCEACRPTLSSILSTMQAPSISLSSDPLGNIVMLASTLAQGHFLERGTGCSLPVVERPSCPLNFPSNELKDTSVPHIHVSSERQNRNYWWPASVGPKAPEVLLS